MARTNSENVYLQGKAKWVKTHGLNPWGKWTVTLYPVPASLEIIRDLQIQGLKNTLRKDDDGYHMNFSRPFDKEFKDKNGTTRKIGFTPVELVDSQGLPFDGYVGNGSDVTIKLEVYQHGTPGGGKAKAARLTGIRVDNLVPYTPADYDEEQQRQLRGLDKQPPQLF